MNPIAKLLIKFFVSIIIIGICTGLGFMIFSAIGGVAGFILGFIISGNLFRKW